MPHTVQCNTEKFKVITFAHCKSKAFCQTEKLFELFILFFK